MMEFQSSKTSVVATHLTLASFESNSPLLGTPAILDNLTGGTKTCTHRGLTFVDVQPATGSASKCSFGTYKAPFNEARVMRAKRRTLEAVSPLAEIVYFTHKYYASRDWFRAIHALFHDHLHDREIPD